MELALQIVLVITSLLVVLLVLLHRAKGGGLSTLFGGGVQSSLGVDRGGEEPGPAHLLRHRDLGDLDHRRRAADQARRIAPERFHTADYCTGSPLFCLWGSCSCR